MSSPLTALRLLLPQPPAPWVSPGGSASPVFYRFVVNLLNILIGGLTIQAGMIVDFAGPAANVPAGYLVCDGSLQQIGAFPALFEALGTTWGGDGVTTFGLPNFVNRFALGATSAGQTGGSSTVTLTAQNLPLAAASNVTAGAAAGGVTAAQAVAFAIMPPYASVLKLVKT